jgi:hypothetical protein
LFFFSFSSVFIAHRERMSLFYMKTVCPVLLTNSVPMSCLALCMYLHVSFTFPLCMYLLCMYLHVSFTSPLCMYLLCM